MSEIEQKLRSLKLKKARLFFDIESLSEVSDSILLNFGKVEAEILKLEKKQIQSVKNIFE